MPIVAWNCGVCGEASVPLDHYETSACGERVHPDYPAAILRHERGHHRHGRRVIGVTDVIGCPRRAAMQHDVDYAVDPTELNSPSTGSAWDAWVTGDRAKESLTGVFGSVEVCGEPDSTVNGKVRDWKHGNDFAKKYREEAKMDHVAQISMYAEMKRQRGETIKPTGIIDYHFSSEYGWAVEVTLMGVDEILAYRPTEGVTTVAEHLAMLEEWRVGKRQWQDLPLTGEEQSYGAKSACDYCSLRSLCWTQARGAAF